MTEHTRHQTTEMSIASARVAAIVEAAERAADELREQTRREADELLAAADRDQATRLADAETQAREILEAARREAHGLVAEARDEAAALRAGTEGDAAGLRRDAEAQAREIVTGAHATARHVLRDGTALSEQLDQLSGSLRRNAERLLRDIQLAHVAMVAELEDAAPGDAATFTAEGSPGEGDEELGVRAWHRDDDHEREAADEAPATIRTEFGIPEFLPDSR
jgi:cell division septum initiation protein DivIVA